MCCDTRLPLSDTQLLDFFGGSPSAEQI